MSQDTRGKREGENRAAAAALGLLADDSGAVLMWTLFIALPVLFALGALVVDAHRTYNTFDEAQNFADHTALAAAMELNGQAGAIDRAITATCGPGPGPLVKGTHTYGSGDHELDAWHLRFFSALGSDDKPKDDEELCTATCGGETTCAEEHDANAHFIEVTTLPVTVNWLVWPLMQAFGGDALDPANVAARATAGMTAKAWCNWPPLWVCNPLQLSGGSLNDPKYIGMQIHVKRSEADKESGAGNKNDETEPSTKKCTPGNYGLVEPPIGNGGNGFVQSLNMYNPLSQICITDYSVTAFEQGAKVGPVEKAFEDRFCPTDPAMPKDSCFEGGTCQFADPNFGDRFGKGDWCPEQGQIDGRCPSRFEALYEPQRTPSCSKQEWTPLEGHLDRREFLIAIVDCCDSDGNDMYAGNSQKVIPVREYVRAFLTDKPGEGQGTAQQDIFFEYLGPADPWTLPGVFKEYPVLYR